METFLGDLRVTGDSELCLGEAEVVLEEAEEFLLWVSAGDLENNTLTLMFLLLSTLFLPSSITGRCWRS